MCNIDDSEKINQNFEVDGVKYQLDGKHLYDLSLHDTSLYSKNMTPLTVN